MRKTILSTIASLFLGITFIQAQNSIWSVPPNYADFSGSGGTPVIQALPTQTGTVGTGNVPNYQGLPSQYTHNAMQDANGDLLFFIVDGIIYDKEGYGINKLNGAGCDPCNGFSETAIIPVPGNCEQFYIIGTQINTSAGHNTPWVGYALLDLSVTSDITQRQGALLDLSNLPYQEGYGTSTLLNLSALAPDYYAGSTHIEGYGGLAITKQRSDNSRFLFFAGQTDIYRFKITSTGINYDGYRFDIKAFFTPASAERPTRTEMEIIETPSGYRFAWSYPNQMCSTCNPVIPGGNTLMVAEMNTNGDIISASTKTLERTPTGPAPDVKGIEFSPNGNYVYITHHITDLHSFPFKIYDVVGQDFTMPNWVSPAFVNQMPAYEYSRIELGIDDKLYFANANGFATLGNSNDPSNLAWNNSATPFSYNLSTYGFPQAGNPPTLWAYQLPDQIDGMDYSNLPGLTISISATATTICQGAPVTLTASGSSGYTWISSTGETYTGSQIMVGPSVTTTYTVTDNNTPCESQESITITVHPTPNFDLGSDIVLCAGDPFPTICPTGSFGKGTSYSWSGPGIVPGTVTTGCYQPTQYGYYCLTVTGPTGCSTTKCINVSEHPNSSYDPEYTLAVSCSSGSNVTITPTFTPLPAGMSELVLVEIQNGPAWNIIDIDNDFDISNVTFLQGEIYRIRRRVSGPCFPFQEIIDTASCFAGRRNGEVLIHVDGTELLETVNYSIFPNPNNGHFNIELTSTKEDVLIEVHDLMGKQVLHSEMNGPAMRLDLSDQPKGVYLVKITVGEEVFNERVVYQ